MEKRWIAALALCAMLAGCGGAATPGGAQTGKNLPSAGGDVRLLTSPEGSISTVGGQTESGYYELAQFSQAGYNILYTDYASQRRIYLCNRPECQHLDDSCTSWVGYTSGGVFLAVDQEKLYVVVQGAPDNSDSPEEKCGRILQMDLDGGNRKTVKVFEPTQALLSGITSDGANLYFILQQFTQSMRDYTKYLAYLNVESGNLSFLKELSIKDSVWVMGGKGRNLLMLENKKGAPSDKTGEEGYQQNRDRTEQVYSEFSLENGESRELLRCPLTQRMVSQKGSTLYYIDYTDAGAKTQDLYDQAIHTAKTGLELTGHEHTNNLAVWDGHLTYETVEPLGDGKINLKFYAVGMEDGSYTDNLLSFTSPYSSSPYLVNILAEFDDVFLVRKALKTVQKNYYYLDGHAETREMGYPEYAFIAKEDYWNGVANYIPISDQVFG